MSRATETVQIGLDGIVRAADLEADISDACLAAFSTPAGERVLQYLRNITLMRATAVGTRSRDLHAAEGARRLVAMLHQRIDHGRKLRTDRESAG